MQTSANTRLINNALLFCSPKQVKEFNEEPVQFRLFRTTIVNGQIKNTHMGIIISTHANVMKKARAQYPELPPGSILAECIEPEVCSSIYSN